MNFKSQFELTSMILRIQTPGLKAPEKLLLATLSTYADSKGESIHPSLKTLSLVTGMSLRAVQDNISRLVDKGFLTKRSGGVIDGVNVPNSYYLNFSALGFELKTEIKSTIVPIDGYVAPDGSKWACVADYWKSRQNSIDMIK